MLLIIDDDIAVQTSLKLLLKQAGFQSESASNPDEARKILSKNTFELILLDMNFSLSTTISSARSPRPYSPNAPATLSRPSNDFENRAVNTP